MKDHDRCDSCGREYLSSELTEFDEQMLCPDCLQTATVICTHCGTRIWKDDNAGDNDTPLCQHCYDRYYFSCSRCGRIIHEDDAYYEGDDDDSDPLCGACYSRRHSSGAIEDYCYKPTPVFRGDGPRFFGVELAG